MRGTETTESNSAQNKKTDQSEPSVSSTRLPCSADTCARNRDSYRSALARACRVASKRDDRQRNSAESLSWILWGRMPAFLGLHHSTGNANLVSAEMYEWCPQLWQQFGIHQMPSRLLVRRFQMCEQSFAHFGIANFPDHRIDEIVMDVNRNGNVHGNIKR